MRQLKVDLIENKKMKKLKSDSHLPEKNIFFTSVNVLEK